MRVCILGGIFDKPADYRAAVRTTPETSLVEGLRARGHEVEARGHHTVGDLSRFELIHVHHLARGAMLAAASQGPARLVFTNHATTHNSLAHYFAFRFVVSRSDAVVAMSESEAGWQRANARVDEKQHIIPHGIRSDIFRYSPPRRGRGPLRLLYVGQLAAFKGIDYLLDALSEVQDDFDLELHLVYHVDTGLQRLRDRVHRLQLEHVCFLGPRTPEELAELYAAADVLVLPSTTEAFPLVICEAMMVGRPVVATDVGGVRGQVGSFGVVVPPRDAHALARALRHVVSNYDSYARSAQAVSRRASRQFSLAGMIGRHERVYERVLTREPRRMQYRYRAGSRLARRAISLRLKWQGYAR